MDDGADTDEGGDEVESALLGGAVFHLVPHGPVFALDLGILGERFGKDGLLIFDEAKLTFFIGGFLAAGSGCRSDEEGKEKREGKRERSEKLHGRECSDSNAGSK